MAQLSVIPGSAAAWTGELGIGGRAAAGVEEAAGAQGRPAHPMQGMQGMQGNPLGRGDNCAKRPRGTLSAPGSVGPPRAACSWLAFSSGWMMERR